MVSAALNGDLEEVFFHPHPIFQVLVPEIVPAVAQKILDPPQAWQDGESYNLQAQELAHRFVENFLQFTTASQEIMAAGLIWE
ncbi:phosphoenolpyruvate carboxykinase [Microcystis aeruginosa NIES-4325]|uniref:Phosphoenolpyruvate carboxykinase n=1 Tax=Microcystis aeruginosa NIES-4325 TaxID=2569534 RepID=A0A5J4FCE9_MICAE|nr:phosphoenolpyruvate carboxykinase [Microcystis aeruginosa NIES-4325]